MKNLSQDQVQKIASKIAEVYAGTELAEDFTEDFIEAYDDVFQLFDGVDEETAQMSAWRLTEEHICDEIEFTTFPGTPYILVTPRA